MFIQGTDQRSANSIGNGAPVSNMEQQVFYTPDATITNFDPYAASSTFVRIKGAELSTNKTKNQTPYYDQFEEIGVKSGRVETSFECVQDYYGLAESIKKLENQELWYAEGLQDDRVLEINGKPIFQEIAFYKAKLVDFSDDKGDIFRVTGSGKFNSATAFTVIKGLTPVSLTTNSDLAMVSGVSENITITAKDLYGDTIDISDLSSINLAGEIVSISLEKVSGSATLTTSPGADDSIIATTLTGSAGTNVLRVKAVTKNGGTFYSENISIVLS